MIRYVKQRDLYSCGPIAVLNALKWAGIKVTLRDLAALKRDSSCARITGCLATPLGEALRKHSENHLIVTFDESPAMSTIESQLRSGGAVLLNFLWNELDAQGVRHGHYSLIVGISKSGSSFTCINHKKDTTMSSVRRDVMRKYLRRRKCEGAWYPVGWYLQKVDE